VPASISTPLLGPFYASLQNSLFWAYYFLLRAKTSIGRIAILSGGLLGLSFAHVKMAKPILNSKIFLHICRSHFTVQRPKHLQEVTGCVHHCSARILQTLLSTNSLSVSAVPTDSHFTEDMSLFSGILLILGLSWRTHHEDKRETGCWGQKKPLRDLGVFLSNSHPYCCTV